MISSDNSALNINQILSKVDHTLLSQSASRCDIEALCTDGIKYKVASVCLPPCYVEFAKKFVGSNLKICTVIGFPNGCNTSCCKISEAEEALRLGADEIDMVINIGALKDKRFDFVESEISSVKRVCGEHILKVIVETCLLTHDEKIKMCEIVTSAGADYIKTSTGFSKEGARIEDITLFKNHIGNGVKIKAAGGISSIEDAQNFLRAGASRLGTSRIVKLAKQMNI